MIRQAYILPFILLCHCVFGQVYQGLVVPDKKGRFGTTSEITQASGLALDANGISLWTHNDQGNATTKVYKILTSTGENTITIQKVVNILNAQNLDWEDFAADNAGNIFLCQTGKNCNANSDPLECPNRFIFKFHKLPLASLNHPDSTAVTPVTYFFKYPLTGYDVNNCHPNDTVFVNCEAVIWHNGAIYLFTKNIWSKATNNCGGWTEGYTYMFKLSLTAGSSMANPLVAQYMGKVNLKMSPTEDPAKYNVTAAAISPDHTILSLITYGRIWQFRNFTGDQFFSGTGIYNDYSLTGTDTITRGYEGVEFINNHAVTLCVDGVNGRLSGIDLDSLALWVRNTNNTGPGSLRNALQTATTGDTLRFKSAVVNDTITLTSGPLIFSRNVHLIQPAGQPVVLQSFTTNTITIPVGKSISLKNINIICGNASDAGVLNDGSLTTENVKFYNHIITNKSMHNRGTLLIKGACQLYGN
ncbi:MAG TPA: hypothetical protein VFG10_12600 [Saprospiraceae bacterium]|nr:hypothetical protein [Saprospiraceae bacterium]